MFIMKKLFLAVALLSALTCGATINKANMKVAYTAKTAGKVDFTVLNKVGDKGFVILDSQDQVLGYSDAGTFDYDKMPENFKWWLSQYQEQINWARANSIKAAPVKALSDSDSIIVQPLLGETEWSQSLPYSMYCPPDGNYYSAVGCVATAMAQIMYYHKWPMRGHGYHEYEWNGNTISRNFSESIYDWDNMLPKYRSGEYTDEQGKAVSRLCADAGISVDMQYTASGSGAASRAIKYAFARNFGYSAKAHYLVQFNMPKEKWDSILVAELDAARPILYCGHDDNGNGGHAFVCDGYTQEGFFHFNWGWNGSGNGYFKTGALNVSGYKFNIFNDITIGIEPRSTVLVDGLCYEIMSDSTVVFTYRDDSEYTDSLVIPEEVTIDSVTYKVSGLTPGCLSEQVIAPSIQVPWTTPPAAERVFSDFVYKNTVLIVPDNCVELYANTIGWDKFLCIKDTIGHSFEWSEWEPFDEGRGTYIYKANYFFDKGFKDTDMPISVRKSKTNEGQWQFRLLHWSYDTELYITYDSITGNCFIPKQYAGYEILIDGVEASVYISDVPNFSSKYTYEKYPCKYDAEKGLFTLNVIYQCGGENDDAYKNHGVETFQIDGFLTDMFAIYDYDKTFGKKIGVRITAANGIKSCKYVFVEGEISQDSVAVVAQQIADTLIESKTAYVGLSTYKPASVSKTYTMVIAGFGKNGDFRNYTSTIVNYNDIYDMKLGDANKDDAIDVSDITTTAAYILGNKPTIFNRFSADIDKDGVITVADITALAAMILGNE